jgi:hypothetical protein
VQFDKYTKVLAATYNLFIMYTNPNSPKEKKNPNFTSTPAIMYNGTGVGLEG